MNIILQIWGGGFYLSHKILLAIAENKSLVSQRKLRIAGWLCFMIGVPAWLIILIEENDWIAASIELASLPVIFLGLYNAYHNNQKQNQLLKNIVKYFIATSITTGLGYSLFINSGITSLQQILEIFIMIGFLLGSYFLAQNKAIGWLMFAIMNLSMATLMLIHENIILFCQQLISLCFIIYGYSQARHKQATTS